MMPFWKGNQVKRHTRCELCRIEFNCTNLYHLVGHNSEICFMAFRKEGNAI